MKEFKHTDKHIHNRQPNMAETPGLQQDFRSSDKPTLRAEVQRNRPPLDIPQLRAATEQFQEKISSKTSTQSLQTIPSITPQQSLHTQIAKEQVSQSSASGTIESRIRAQQETHSCVSEIFHAMRGGATGIGTDEPRLFRALERKTPDQIKHITDAYRERFGRDLVQDITNELKQDRRFSDRVKPLLAGDLIKGEAAGIKFELDMPTKNGAEILRRLSALSQSELQQVSKVFEENYKMSLKGALSTKLTVAELAQATSLLDQKPERYEAMKLRELLQNRSSGIESLIERVREWDGTKLAAVQEEYRKLYGSPLEHDMVTAFGTRSEERIQLILQGDKLGVLAHELHSMIHDPERLFRAIHDSAITLDPKDFAALRDRYKKDFGTDLSPDISKALEAHPLKLKVAQAIAMTGEISPAEEIVSRLAVSNTVSRSVVKHELAAILEPLSAPLAQQLSIDVKQRYQIDLEGELKKILKKPDTFDIRSQLPGKPDTLEDEVSLLNAKYDYERKQEDNFISRIVDRHSEQARVLETNVQRLNEQYRKLSQPGRQISEEDELELLKLIDFAEDDLRKYRSKRLSISRAASSACGLLGFVLGTFIGREIGEPMMVSLAMGAVAGGVTKLVSKFCFDQKFGPEDELVNKIKTSRGSAREKKRSRRMRPGSTRRRSRLGPLPRRHTFISW